MLMIMICVPDNFCSDVRYFSISFYILIHIVYKLNPIDCLYVYVYLFIIYLRNKNEQAITIGIIQCASINIPTTILPRSAPILPKVPPNETAIPLLQNKTQGNVIQHVIMALWKNVKESGCRNYTTYVQSEITLR